MEASIILRNPALEELEGEAQLASLLSGHFWFTTSGTTSGARRWVALSREAFNASAAAVNRHLAVSAADVWLNVLPLFHVGGLAIHARAGLSGSRLVERSKRKWNLTEFVADLKSEKVTLTSLVPTQVFDLVQGGIRAPENLRAVVVGGGALPEALYLAGRGLGWPLLPSFGMTECASQVATAPLGSLSADGMPKLELLDHIQAALTEEGVLKLHSPALFTAYAESASGALRLNDPKVDGWLTTSDRAKLDGNGLVPLGRVEEQVKILGELVSLQRLNEVLSGLLLERSLSTAGREPAVLTAVPHSRSGREIVLVSEALSSEDREMLVREFNRRVLPFERIARSVAVTRIPRTALGKIKLGSLPSVSE